MPRPLAVIVLAAGAGTRTKVSNPKVLLPLCGRTLLATVLDEVATLKPERTVVVLHHDKERVAATFEGRAGVSWVDQGETKGTGHGVQVAMGELREFSGDVLITYGDMPLVRGTTFEDLRGSRGDASAALLTAFPDDCTGLGRILRDDQGELAAVREERDCTEEEEAVDEVNCGVYCCDAECLRPALAALTTDNDQGEYYLTDIAGWFVRRGQRVATWEVEDPMEACGVNDLRQLSNARMFMQDRILLHHLERGVLIEDPATTFIDWAVEIGAETRILPCTVIGTGVRIGARCEVGPFAHLRAATVLEDGAEVGNFVEVKKSVLGAGTKAKHLTYLGDATIGARVNIGAGTITANYDGVNKHPTIIGDGAFVGSGTVLVAPATMAEGSMTGAGAIVTRNTTIGPNEVYVGVPARPHKAKSEGVE